MSIMRVMVTDPTPRHPKDDIIVYQVPEKSRACELLVELLAKHGLDFVEIPGKPNGRKVTDETS
jgi:hypothetical protein